MTQPAEPQIPEEELSAAEAAFAAAVAAALAGFLASAAATVLAPWRLFRLPPDPTALFTLRVEWVQEVDRLLESLTELARRGWDDVARQLGVNLPFDATDSGLDDMLGMTRNLLVRIPDEIYRRIMDELAASSALGEDAGRQAARVEDILNVTGSENWPARARTIAVTEVNRVYAMGQQAAAMRSHMVLSKSWSSRDDARVRRAHVLADGQTVPLMQPFIVADEPLMFPGDPRGRPSNVINCRCRLKVRRP